MMTLKIQDLIDIEQFQLLQDRLNEIYSFPSAIIDNDGKVLTATAWQDICTKFHRQNSECEKECVKSDQYIADHLHEANPAVSYRCPHGLIDNATPIIIDGVHYGNYFTGQFFLEKPDLNFFRAQAKQYGFDEEAYIEAVKKVPIWTQEQLNSYLFFIKGLIEVIAGIGLKNLKEIETRHRMQEIEERHRNILRTAMDGFWMTDMQGRLLDVNEAYCRMSGYSEQELLVMRIPDLEIVEKANDTDDHIQKIMAQGEDRFESRHRRKDGSVFDIEVSVQYRSTGDGQMIAFLRDITERKRAEEKLVAGHKLLSNLASLVPGVIYQYRLYPDGHSAFPYASQAMNDIYEVTPEEVREDATPVFGRLHPDDHDRVAADILESARTLETFYCEFRVILPRQGLRWRWSQAQPQRLDDGSTLWHGIISDITERKQAEQEKAKLQAQLLQSQKMESVGRLAGGVAHDFNNMLGVILGHAEIAMDQVDPAQPLHADLQEIRNAANRSADLTRQLLAFARKQVISPKVVDLNDTVAGMLKMLQRLIGEDIHLVWQPDVSLRPIRVDPSQIDQLLANLCINARDAIAGVGKLTIETGNTSFDEDYCADHAGFVPGEYVLLAVSDDGCGMDKEILDKLFEPFFTTKGVGKGTGLGLATVYGIVKQNNGFINVYSEPGKGTTFRIYLPRYIGQAEQIQRQEMPEPILRGQETILLVEDEPTLLELSKILLETQGYRVLAAGAPSEAIRLAGEYSGAIHLLMTDVVMPEMNGRDLADKMLSLNPNLRCLFTSGYTADVIAHHGVLDENVHFIRKPFSRKDLAAKVREALDQK
ncbi:MAG: PocR ligand-binding domain-containing protein [Syntrophales bacterium]